MLEEYKDVLTVKEVYEILPIGWNSLYNLIHTDKIKHIKVGRKTLIPKIFLIEFLNGE